MKRRHEYDQHYLSGPRLVAELIGHSNLRKNDLVYDFGAGSGVITSVLARRVRSVVAVELEPNALELLKRNVSQFENVTVLRGDALGVSLPNEPYKVFANPPFSITAALIKRLSESALPPKAMYFVVQRQFARKTVPSDQHFTSALGIALSPLYTARIRKPLHKTDFTPPPAVDTVLLELKLRETPLLEPAQMPAYREFISMCFADPKVFARTPRQRFGISPERKPSELTPEQWIQLFLG